MNTRPSAGFTLLELMVTVAIIAILAAIAYPNYQDYVMRSRRAAAAVCLTEVSQFMERFYTTNLRYNATTGGAAVTLPALQCMNDIAGHYTISFSAAPTATTYAIQAVPQGAQAMRDVKCGTLGLNQAGAKTKSGTGTVAECW
ncbi:type IV pilin protein [Silanimonas lenta]|uniref:type IV pilin protein n=1 Tax=Silanimonas lenta TaxID=265429 RepID=UPI002FE17D29